ncbi:50S ribosomal protein L3, partial [Candidatus Falkowbacteria bacterium]
QVWQGEDAVAVTRLQVGSCVVVQKKTKEKDGYSAVQLGFGERKEKNIKKPQKGSMKGLGNFMYLREFSVENEELKRGDKIEINSFMAGDIVQTTAVSKGKGFQGVVKRHGFKGQSKTHGTKDQLRMPGSIGATGPAHVFKGQKMPGRMGGGQVTTKNLEIIKVDIKNNVLSVKGAVPGARNGLVLISGEGDLNIVLPQTIEKKDKKEIEKEDNIQKTVEEAKEKVDKKQQTTAEKVKQ